MKTRDTFLLEQAYAKIYLKEESYIDKLKRLNPKWDPEKAKTDFADEYDPDDAADIEDHVDYEENKNEFIDNLVAFTPGVKVGDWVKVKVHGGGGVKPGWAIGKIEGEALLRAHDYGSSGYAGPSVIPAWNIRVFVPVPFDEYLDKVPGSYVITKGEKPQAFSSRGHISYAQHDEIQSNTGVEQYKTYKKDQTFTKLPNQNLSIIDID